LNPPVENDLRCNCGSLLAKKIGDRVQLKCRRCKRVAWLNPATMAAGSTEKVTICSRNSAREARKT
jgi:phage FluMu protein Com